MAKETEHGLPIKISAHCKETLYRAVWRSTDGPITVYVHAEDVHAARSRLSITLGCLVSDQAGAIDLGEVYSYAELLRMGTSDREDLRIFETGRTGDAVVEWVDRPLFLSTDQTLIAQWVMLLMYRVRLVARAVDVPEREAGGRE
ncbi:hypothetical protein [Burkholderia diffusa]|uniref:hypothetical protein n=1 Tax=Burkholderia diffusa TaxID=488732 RepID=UPI00157B7A4E|nr:hypothetical protein [Burkholderia diffusa]NTY41451.1 hypothetical protein [Burkholderia diffusa]